MAAVKKITTDNKRRRSSKELMKDDVKVTVDVDRDQSIQVTDQTSPTLPSKDEEFEKFKKGRGKKINEIFLSNKGKETHDNL